MINTEIYGAYITSRFGFFTGVPDSLLKELCLYIDANISADKNIIAVNEGAAVALASGYFLSSGQCAVVYMQNSGIGNALNPLLSLADPLVFSIPMLLLIGWRGEPGVRDEPQHDKQGLVTERLLEAAGIEYAIHGESMEKAAIQIEKAREYMKNARAPYALIVRQNTFSSYGGSAVVGSAETSLLSRESAIEEVLRSLAETDLVVSTTGKISRELYELREERGEGHRRDFMTVGSMGYASQIAASVSLCSGRRVVCLDGDGAVLMHMGGLATIGVFGANILHIVLNNASHDSVGGQPTVAQKIDLCSVASACGYVLARRVVNRSELRDVLRSAVEEQGAVFIEVIVGKGARVNLGRPKQNPRENKLNFMMELKR
jgi:phosphonopyruvate decarboxylase